jgi:hypothetical protein
MKVVMRFLMLMIPGNYTAVQPGTLPELEAVEAMMKYNKKLDEAGVLLSLEGLHPPAEGVRVSFAGGRPVVHKGPFPEAKEAVGGYWLIRAGSLDEAVKWAALCPANEKDTIEIRQIQEVSDFSEEIQAVVRGFDESRRR